MDSSRAVGGFACLCLILLSAAPPAAAAQSGDKHTLQAHHQPGAVSRVQVAVQVGGDLKLVGADGKSQQLPMSVVANLGYDEVILTLDEGGRPVRSARYYDDTRAVIKIDKGGEKPTFNDAHRLIVAERKDRLPCLLYSPAEALVREELDLIDVPCGTLVLDDTLPAEPVAVGESWKLDDPAVAALLCVDAVSWSDVECVLGEISDDGLADIAAAGSVSAAVGGIATEIQLKIKYKFDTRAGRITAFAMLIKEKRAVGHVGPGLDTVAKLIVKVTPLAASKTLTPAVVARLPAASTPELLDLGYAPRGGPFHLQYDRRWYVTGDEQKLTVLRMVDRGELVAQCNLSALPPTKKPVTLAEFQRDIVQSLGKNFGRFASAGQTTNPEGYSVFRVTVHGTVAELPIEWIYYLVQDQEGRRVSLSFTLEEGQRQRFAEADRRVVDALRLRQPPAPTAAKPVQTK